MEKIAYRSGYKYQLAADYTLNIGLYGLKGLIVGFMKLDTDGTLTIHAGYAWDGPSGPTFDSKNFMRGSLVHDALYQLMRSNQIPLTYRDFADSLLRKHCREDGMSWLRAWWVYRALRAFGAAAAAPKSKKPTLYAP